MAKAPTVKLWSVKNEKLLAFTVSAAGPEIICSREDEEIKFPGGVDKKQFLKFVKDYNDANKDQVPVREEDLEAAAEVDTANDKLLKDLA